MPEAAAKGVRWGPHDSPITYPAVDNIGGGIIKHPVGKGCPSTMFGCPPVMVRVVGLLVDSGSRYLI